MSGRFAGQVALIAGGTGGLGRAVSAEFVGEDATVVVTYKHESEFVALRAAAGANASKLEGHAVDVMDAVAVQQFVNGITARHGRLDAAVNCVGEYAAGSKLWEMKPEVMDQMMSLNLQSGFVLFRAVVPAMQAKDQGAIVNVASRAAIDHAGSAAAYAASKSAAVAMIDSLAAYFEGHEHSREFDTPEHHRYRRKPQGNAQGRFFEVAETARNCSRNSLSMQ